MLRVLVVGLVVLVAAIFIIPRAELGALQAATLLPQPRTLPDVALVDSQKHPLHLKDLEGQYTLLFFGFTNCPDVCPLTLKALADARAELARRAPRVVPPRVVFVSVDPQRDDFERIAAYVARFDASFIGARAPERVLEPLLAALGVTVEKHSHGEAQYNVMHSGAVYILNPKAEWIAVANGPHDPAVFATDYLKIRQRRPAA
jgi:protein SCO1/2